MTKEFWVGVEQFNQKDFYACHDTLEALWMEAEDRDRNFYQGILQIAVSLYHLGNSNWRGAVILLGEGISRLRNYEPAYCEIDVEKLIDASTELLRNLQQAGPENVSDFVEKMKAGSLPTPYISKF